MKWPVGLRLKGILAMDVVINVLHPVMFDFYLKQENRYSLWHSCQRGSHPSELNPLES